MGIDALKKLTAKRRHAMCALIAEWVPAKAVAHVEAARIDEVGITVALGEACQCSYRWTRWAGNTATVVLLDGKFDFLTPVRSGFEVRTVVGGDGRCASIAAASILAKEERTHSCANGTCFIRSMTGSPMSATAPRRTAERSPSVG